MIRLVKQPMLHVINAEQSVLSWFRSKGLARNMHRPILATEQDPEPNPGPDASFQTVGSSISPEDWDELFRAVQARLESCVDDALTKAPETPLHSGHEVTKKTVLECVESMKQLHAELTVDRQAYGRR
ncbi:MAG: hypothetical protein HQ446_10445 [Polaromonas sp.]|nr:hypothetical protein [Polaromonas sp.]